MVDRDKIAEKFKVDPTKHGLPNNFGVSPEEYRYVDIKKKGYEPLVDYLEEISKITKGITDNYKEGDIVAISDCFLEEMMGIGYKIKPKEKQKWTQRIRQDKRWGILPIALGVGGSFEFAFDSFYELIKENAAAHPDFHKIASNSITALAYSGLFVYKNTEAIFHRQLPPIKGVDEDALDEAKSKIHDLNNYVRERIKMVGIMSLLGIETVAGAGHFIELFSPEIPEAKLPVIAGITAARFVAAGVVIGAMAPYTYIKNYMNDKDFHPKNFVEKTAKKLGNYIYEKTKDRDPRIRDVLIPAVTGAFLAAPAFFIGLEGVLDSDPFKITASIGIITAYLMTIRKLSKAEHEKHEHPFVNDKELNRFLTSMVEYSSPLLKDRVKNLDIAIQIYNEFGRDLKSFSEIELLGRGYKEGAVKLFSKFSLKDIPKDTTEETVRILAQDIEYMAARSKSMFFINKPLPEIEQIIKDAVVEKICKCGDFEAVCGKLTSALNNHFTKVWDLNDHSLLETGTKYQRDSRLIGSDEAIVVRNQRQVTIGKDTIQHTFKNGVPEVDKFVRERFNANIDKYNKNLSATEKYIKREQRSGVRETIKNDSGKTIWSIDSKDSELFSHIMRRVDLHVTGDEKVELSEAYKEKLSAIIDAVMEAQLTHKQAKHDVQKEVETTLSFGSA